MSAQTQAERDAVSRAVMTRSAKMAGVSWPMLDATLEEPKGTTYTLLCGPALVDCVVQEDDGCVYVAAVLIGGAWVYADSLGDAFNTTLQRALETALAINVWAGEP